MAYVDSDQSQEYLRLLSIFLETDTYDNLSQAEGEAHLRRDYFITI